MQNYNRLFIAIPVSEDIKNKAAEFQRRFLDLPVRWLISKNLHITLIPPWEEYNLKSARNNFKNLKIKINPFEIKLKNISFGPNLKQPRLIWASGDTTQELFGLKEEVKRKFFGNIVSENKKFFTHLTLARFNPKDFLYPSYNSLNPAYAGFRELYEGFSLRNLNLNEKILWKYTADSVVLIQSYLSPSGADYEILEEIYF